MKRYFFRLLFLAISFGGFAHNPSFDKASDKLYYSYIAQDFSVWKSVIADFHKNKQMSIDSLDFVLSAQYCYVAWLGTADSVTAEAGTALNLALSDLEKFEEKLDKLPTNTVTRRMLEAKYKSYQSAFLAYQILLNPVRVIINGWKCVNGAKSAVNSVPECWFSQIEYGNVMQSMPTVLGGSNINARKAYLKAMSLMEADSDERTTYHNWLYIHLLLCLADSYKAENDYEKVRLYYDKILSIEPTFSYVKDSLMPTLNKLAPVTSKKSK